MAFFEKVGETLAAKGKNVADKAKEMAEMNRLNGLIHSQKNMIEKTYREIGEIVYENRAERDAVDLNSQIEQLDALWKETRRLQREILKVKGLQQCENCGAEIDRNVAFCPKCGAQVVTREEAQEVEDGEQAGETGEPGAARCPGCGKDIEPEAVFCPFCGIRLGE